MAEGGDLTFIKDGSDADFEYTCTPCGDDDIREEAVKFCPVCEEYLCTSCTRQHGRRKATRSHTLQDCDALTTKGTAVTMVTKCRYHLDRDIEMYCEVHDMVYCMKCIIDNHRSCNGVSNLEDVSSHQVKEIERLKTDMKTIQERLDDTDQKLKTNISSVEKQRNEIISQIEGIEREFVDHIRKLKHKALEALNSDFTLAKEEVEINVSQISKVKQEIEQACSQLQTVDSMNVRQQFVQTKLVQQTVNNALKVFKQSEAKGCQYLRFTENAELKSLIIASTSLGSVEKTTENNSLLYKVSSQKEINIKMKNDGVQCYINDICQLTDGTIILADSNNKRIKRLDGNYNIKDCLDLESYPRGICCTGNTEVAVKLYNDKVWFISTGNSLSKMRDISVTGGGYWGMAYCAGQLWVSDLNGVNVYNMTDTLLKSFSKDVNGQRIFKSSPQQMAVSGDTIIVTDNSDGAVCLNRDGTVKRELRDKRLANTRGVCVANDGTVFISGLNSNNILMFDRDGKCFGELVGKDAGLIKPTSLLYDDKKNCLIVACNPDKIIVYYT
ncbi:uncharacterized protein LOC132743921 [Ruditapes philippinarum]|uniref:uncharacterized protein LOC132743921 n=1 Tax=Ruditapes philippinarum TaxID=129788 RepID=UPI00295B8F5D|nr:uncharacterized protein LOC132743921 [Ruditapes philippinarum]XP_060588501.1 uncharacterized protein LOC132743921 [Ruditapes philippinarum]XP_060588502.1 uncharacterized protein LOC132743921 [Ruditapes philippinarum]